MDAKDARDAIHPRDVKDVRDAKHLLKAVQGCSLKALEHPKDVIHPRNGGITTGMLNLNLNFQRDRTNQNPIAGGAMVYILPHPRSASNFEFCIRYNEYSCIVLSLSMDLI